MAPSVAVEGAVGAAFGLSALWLERGKHPKEAKRPGLSGMRALGLGAPLVVLAGLTAAAVSAVYTQQVVASSGNFAEAFGAGWQEQIPSELKGGMLAQRWMWKLSVAPGAHVERDLAFATVPGTDRKLLADIWSPPDGVAPSGLGFIYFHGGGYSAFDKGGPTETWFRHLAAQGHVVMDVSITHVGPNSPPTLQFMGEHDVYVGGSPAMAELHEKLRASGVPSVVVEIPRTDHAFDMFFPEVSPSAQTAMYYVDRFLALMASPVDWQYPGLRSVQHN